MEKTIIKFGDIEIEKQTFHQKKTYFNKKQILIKYYLVRSLGKKVFKQFIGYKDEKIRPLCIPKMSSYRRDFHETKYVLNIFFDKR